MKRGEVKKKKRKNRSGVKKCKKRFLRLFYKRAVSSSQIMKKGDEP